MLDIQKKFEISDKPDFQAVEPAYDEGCMYSKDGIFFCFDQEESSEEAVRAYPTQECGKLNDKMIQKLIKSMKPVMERDSEESEED